MTESSSSAMQPDEGQAAFAQIVREHFGFLLNAGMSFQGVRRSGGTDPRDLILVARFSASDFQIEIGWNSYELSLGVLIRYVRPELSRAERYVYFEPFVEFLTNGREGAIVPYITEQMSIQSIELAMDRRRALFSSGVDAPVKAVGAKLVTWLQQVRGASVEAIKEYHCWMTSIR